MPLRSGRHETSACTAPCGEHPHDVIASRPSTCRTNETWRASGAAGAARMLAAVALWSNEIRTVRSHIEHYCDRLPSHMNRSSSALTGTNPPLPAERDHVSRDDAPA